MTPRPTAEKNRGDRASRSKGAGTLGEQAYQQIRTEILFYQLPPGSRVSEASLTQRFNLRQAAVRSALQRLMQEGLGAKADERTLRAAPLTLKDVQDVYGLRILLEPRARPRGGSRCSTAVSLNWLPRISQSSYELTSH